MTDESVKKAFEILGFGNMNILKLPSSIINMEVKELNKALQIAVQHAREEQAKEYENKINNLIKDMKYHWNKVNNPKLQVIRALNQMKPLKYHQKQEEKK